MRRLLIVSPHFPPVNAPDMQRVRMSLPHFVNAGWEVVVLTVDDHEPLAPVEPALLATIPTEVRIVRARCFSRRWTRRLGVNNLGWRTLPFLFAAGRRLLARERFDIVYFSTTQFVVLPIGRLWRRSYGVPYVIDLQDPWLSDHHEHDPASRPPGGWKYRVAHALARMLEGWTMRKVAHVFSVSERYLVSLHERYAWFGGAQGTVLTFGTPDLDLGFARRATEKLVRLLPDNPSLKIAYAGRLGADMLPALAVLFAALASRPSSRKIEVFFFGTSYAPAALAESTTAALATEHGVQDIVHEFPARIGYIDSLRLLLECDVALLLGSTDTAYSPSKIYPTLSAGKPTLALVATGSELQRKLAELGGAAVISFSYDGRDPGAPVAAVRTLLAQFAANPGAPLGDPLQKTLFECRYSSAAIAGEQLRVFNQIVDRAVFAT